MKKLITIIILFASISLQAQTFQFTSTGRYSMSLATEADYSVTNLKTPLNITFDGKKLSMIYENGKEFGSYDVIKIFPANEEGIDKRYVLEVKDNKGLYKYILFEDGSLEKTLMLPTYVEGMLISYTNFIGQ
jgi:hypothetical protein